MADEDELAPSPHIPRVDLTALFAQVDEKIQDGLKGVASDVAREIETSSASLRTSVIGTLQNSFRQYGTQADRRFTHNETNVAGLQWTRQLPRPAVAWL